MKWEPGTWHRWLFGPSNTVGLVLVCPQCTGAMSIGGNPPFGSVHIVTSEGIVQPSVVCPYCAWHTFIRLINWPQVSGTII